LLRNFRKVVVYLVVPVVSMT